MTEPGTFYEDDEPVDKIVAAFNKGEHGITGEPEKFCIENGAGEQTEFEYTPDPVCPTCHRTMEQGCLPSSCPRWTTTAVYDHEQRAWLATDDDGYVVDGRRIEEVP